jgi:MtN3 and saliva related transmembrane protein
MTEAIGFIAGICTTFCALPQILKLIKTRHAKDLSTVMYVMMCIGVILWIIYGYLLGALALIVANFCALILYSTILVMKLMWS